MVQALLIGPEVFVLRPGESVPNYLAPLAALGATSFVVLPLVYQRQLSGIVALGGYGFDLGPDRRGPGADSVCGQTRPRSRSPTPERLSRSGAGVL